MWFVYILQCKDGSLYTGMTNNLAKRLTEHKNGKGGRYTRSRKPIALLYSKTFLTKSDALKREAKIKHMKRREKLDIVARVAGKSTIAKAS